MHYDIEVNGAPHQVEVQRDGARFIVTIDGRQLPVDVVRIDGGPLSLLIEGVSHEVSVVPEPTPGQLAVTVESFPMTVAVDGRRRFGRKDDQADGHGAQKVTAPMPGKVVRIPARPGDSVVARQSLVVIEAMKMENELRASRAGVVTEVHVKEGQSVDAGTLLLVVAPA